MPLEAAMATRGPIGELCEEVTCPICLEYFKDPATIAECGHNFCRACLTRSWGESGSEASCPMCKGPTQPKNLLPNRQLANIVEITRKLSLKEKERKKEAKEGICEKHQEPLNLFCQAEEILICKVCDRSKEHKNHEVIPAEEASQKYKKAKRVGAFLTCLGKVFHKARATTEKGHDKIFSCLETLRSERGEILTSLANVEDESQGLFKRIESERKRAVAEFRTLHQLLKEQEKELLAQIVEVEKEISNKRDKHLARLSQELSSLESLIQEMEEKQQQSASDLLQDIRGTLQRYEKKGTYKNPVVFSFKLKQKVHKCLYNHFLESAMKQFRDSLAWAFPKLKGKVTLNPSSASSCLVLCGDWITMKQQGASQVLEEDPEKRYGCVLGREGFTAGCHFWEVLLEGWEGWAVGVARKSIKGKVFLTPEEGIWAVGRWKGLYKAFLKGINAPLTLRGELRDIRICLNYDGGRVAFFDSDRVSLLYEFSGASFSGETLVPFFAVYGDGCLCLYS